MGCSKHIYVKKSYNPKCFKYKKRNKFFKSNIVKNIKNKVE